MHSYEDFDAWKLARALNQKVWAMTSEPPVASDFRFRDNIRDAADSAERNFPEGFGRFGPKEFARFLDHARASLLETRNQLDVGHERGYFSEADVREARSLADRAIGALAGLQRYLRSERAERNARQIRSRMRTEQGGPEEPTEPTN